MKVLRSESECSLLGTFAPRSESTEGRKGHNSFTCRAHLANCAFDQMRNTSDQMCAFNQLTYTCWLQYAYLRHFVEVRFRVGLGLGIGLQFGLGLVLGLLSWLGLWSNAHLPDVQRIWSNAQIDQMCLTYPHEWSPISCRSSAGQGKIAGQRPMFYRCTTQLTSNAVWLLRVRPCIQCSYWLLKFQTIFWCFYMFAQLSIISKQSWANI